MEPKLRFKEFSGDWEEKKIKNIFNKISRPVKVDLDKSYRQIGIRSHGKGVFYKDEVTGRELGNKRVFWVEPNCFVVNIVFAWELAVAKLTKAEEGMIASHRFPMYKPIKNILDLNYITQYFKSFYGHKILILASPGGAGRNKTLGQEEFLESKIKLPSLLEQTKIADFLSTVDDKIQNQQDKITHLENIKKGFMQKIFSRKIKFKDEQGNEFPDWEEKKLNETGNFYNGLSGKNKDDFENGNAKFITYMNVFKNVIADETMLQSVNIKPEESQNVVEYGDLLFTQSSETIEEVGFSSVWIGRNEYYLNSFCFGFRFNSNYKINPIFMGYLFRSCEIRTKIKKEGQGSTRFNLASSRLGKINIPIPCLEEQQKIADFLSSFDEKIDVEKNTLEHLKELKKGLLQQMFV